MGSSKNNLGIKEIAQLAGVSIGTVDRVLHDRSGVAPQTKQRVLKIVRDTGFKKNIVASRLKLAAKRTIKIAVLIPEIKHEWSYWKLPQAGIDKAVAELRNQGIRIDYHYFDLFHLQTFKLAVQSILEQPIDAVITVPFDQEESQVLIHRAKRKDIPVVFLDTEQELLGSANFIRQNSFKAGMVAGRLLHGLVGDQGYYFVVNILNERGTQINNQQREDGFRAYFDQPFMQKKVSIYTVSHILEEGLDIDPDIVALFQTNVPKGIFVTNARAFLLPDLLEKHEVRHTCIVGFDLNRQNLAYLHSGAIQFLINQKPEYQGYAAVKGLFKFLTEEDHTELNIDIPVEIIVRENAI